jgi:hypothetical protein
VRRTRSRPSPRRRGWGTRGRLAGAATAAAVGLVLTGCGTTPPAIGVTPGSTASPVELPSPTYSSLKIEIVIDQQTVSPLDQQIAVERGRPVVLVTHTDHDTTLVLKGPGLDKKVAVGRKTTITSSFVALQPGVITISTDDPAATIARLTVS